MVISGFCGSPEASACHQLTSAVSLDSHAIHMHIRARRLSGDAAGGVADGALELRAWYPLGTAVRKMEVCALRACLTKTAKTVCDNASVMGHRNS